MKIAVREVQAFLASPDAETFGALIYGQDAGQALAHSRNIIKRILGSTYDPTQLTELDDAVLKSDPARLADECGAISLLGDKRVVWLKHVGERHAGLIESCIPLLGHDCYLLVTCGDLQSRDKIRSLFEKHKQLAALACYRLEGGQLAMHIRGVLESQGFRASRTVVDMLAAELGNDTMITNAELEKLTLYALGNQEITPEDVSAVILNNGQSAIDSLCEYYCDSNGAAFDRMWQQLTREGEPPIVLVRSLIRHINRLLVMKLAMQAENMTAEQAVENARPKIFWKQAPVFTRQLKRLRAGDLLLMLHQCTQAEAGFKSTSLPPEIMAGHVLEMSFAGSRRAPG